MKNSSARQVALDALLEVDNLERYSNKVLSKILNERNLKPADRRLATKLMYGVIENRALLDHIIRQNIKFRINKLDVAIRNILRMGMYQMLFMDSVPDSAAVNEAVNLAKVYQKRYSGFVNGVLRGFIRKEKQYTLPNKKKDAVSYLSIKYSHPDWLIKKWMKQFGADFTEALLSANNQVPDVCIRVNTTLTTKESLIEKLTEEGYTVKEGPLPNALVIEVGEMGLIQSESFHEGLYFIQDIGAMAVGHIANPKTNALAIDMCSAPGGKASHLAELMKDQGRVLSWDIYDHKIEKIKENMNRLKLTSIEPAEKDALLFDPAYEAVADIVLIDAPCSGLGIIRRKPEIKYNKTEHDIQELAKIQTSMLDIAARYVKKDGVLIYSTCTIEPMENEDQIRAFLERHPEFVIESITKELVPESWLEGESQQMLTLYPHIHGTDGFFICKLVKTT